MTLTDLIGKMAHDSLLFDRLSLFWLQKSPPSSAQTKLASTLICSRQVPIRT